MLLPLVPVEYNNNNHMKTIMIRKCVYSFILLYCNMSVVRLPRRMERKGATTIFSNLQN